MGVFGSFSVKNAKVSGGGVYLEPGNYVLEVEATKGILTRNKGPMLVFDFIVRESNNPKFGPGSRVNYTVLMSSDYGPGNAKEVLAASAGLDATSPLDAAAVNAEDWDEVLENCVTKPIFAGRKVRARTVLKDKVKSEGVYTKTFFTPHEETRAALHSPAKKAK